MIAGSLSTEKGISEKGATGEMKKIMLVFGTRPETIKMSHVVKKMGKYPERFETVVRITVQRR